MNIYIVTFENGEKFNVRAKSVNTLAAGLRLLQLTTSQSIQRGFIGGPVYNLPDLAKLIRG